MKKNVKNYVKKAFKGYFNNMNYMYKPCLEAGVNPFTF